MQFAKTGSLFWAPLSPTGLNLERQLLRSTIFSVADLSNTKGFVINRSEAAIRGNRDFDGKRNQTDPRA